MSDWQSFERQIEPMVRGKSTCTILRLPDQVSDLLQAQGTKRVEGDNNAHPIDPAMTHAPAAEGQFLWASQTLFDRLGVSPSERIEVRLRPAPNDLVDKRNNVGDALRCEGTADTWDRLTPGKRRSLSYRISAVRTVATREQRVAEPVLSFREGSA